MLSDVSCARHQEISNKNSSGFHAKCLSVFVLQGFNLNQFCETKPHFKLL